MADDVGSAARRELLAHLRELLKAVRLLKNEMSLQHPAVPAGTLSVLALIDAVAAEPAHGCHVKDLAARSSLDPSTVSRAVAAVVRAGLVARAADPHDGRASVLGLTAAGRQALGDAMAWSDNRLAAALENWSVADVSVFTALLQRFSADLMSHYEQPLEAAR
ncbi:MarR family winged helix-turn-helix transcriptional regulator [Actinoplanes sp. NPDC049548]|uniref:MarR family winged helix-turn-helix transcriptional regulator n=1 Tax=Actinoplanes sp. NPDC049548 TaxID=3155152 RepID=UPI003414513E